MPSGTLTFHTSPSHRSETAPTPTAPGPSLPPCLRDAACLGPPRGWHCARPPVAAWLTAAGVTVPPPDTSVHSVPLLGLGTLQVPASSRLPGVPLGAQPHAQLHSRTMTGPNRSAGHCPRAQQPQGCRLRAARSRHAARHRRQWLLKAVQLPTVPATSTPEWASGVRWHGHQVPLPATHSWAACLPRAVDRQALPMTAEPWKGTQQWV